MQLDIKTAYLNAPLDKEIYIYIFIFQFLLTMKIMVVVTGVLIELYMD